MKNSILATFIFMSLPGLAGTTATLNLKGTIAPVLNIEITPETLATALPLNQAMNNQKVGKVTEKSNSGAGYKITVASQNGGKLVRVGDSSSFINYQLSYNNGNIPLNTNQAQIATNSQRGQFDRDLHITYSKPADYMSAGEYSDVVTFTIAAN